MSQVNNKLNQTGALFFTISNLVNNGAIEALLNIIVTYGNYFGISGYTVSRGAKNPRYKLIDNQYLLKEICEYGNISTICFGGNKPYHFELWLNLDDGKIVRNRYNMTSISIKIDNTFFVDNDKTNHERLAKYIHFLKDIYFWSQPLCAYSHDVDDKLAIGVSLSKRGIFKFFGFANSTEHGVVEQPHIDCPLTGIFWVNFIGPKGVSFYGRERLLQAPGVVQKEKLKDGGILLLTAPHPLTPDDPIQRANQLYLWNFLGLKPVPNLKAIAKYKSSERFNGALLSYE